MPLSHFYQGGKFTAISFCAQMHNLSPGKFHSLGSVNYLRIFFSIEIILALNSTFLAWITCRSDDHEGHAEGLYMPIRVLSLPPPPPPLMRVSLKVTKENKDIWNVDTFRDMIIVTWDVLTCTLSLSGRAVKRISNNSSIFVAGGFSKVLNDIFTEYELYNSIQYSKACSTEWLVVLQRPSQF